MSPVPGSTYYALAARPQSTTSCEAVPGKTSSLPSSSCSVDAMSRIRSWHVVSFGFGLLLIIHGVVGGSPLRPVELAVHNPYRWSVQIEVKCDWIPEDKRFSYTEIHKLRPKKTTNLRVPAGLTQCQIWPHVDMF